ncbi:hypothetical protein HHK36_022487 [Tetracentron sinense]|uniref:RRM domain-containing protein n=1 Tax=Tetracentron sinense TaxID=13715 RepID=A0A834YS16_TETSI|nr:hypothetical protein HHK36_022487 [Tetracentron sinense]
MLHMKYSGAGGNINTKKIFVGELLLYFEVSGHVTDVVIMYSHRNQRPRRFGFITFDSEDVVDRILHIIFHEMNGKLVEVKRALPEKGDGGRSMDGGNYQCYGASSYMFSLHLERKLIPNSDFDDCERERELNPVESSSDVTPVVVERALLSEEQPNSSSSENLNAGRSSEAGGNIKTKQIFVGGLPHTLTKGVLKQYFEAYGCVTKVEIKYDRNPRIRRGFGFIFFDSEDVVDRVLHKRFHKLNGKFVEVKRALPKVAYGGNYEGCGSSSADTSTYEGRMDSSRYMQPQTTGGGFSAYGSSGYGYGVINSGVGYGGYCVSGYGSSNAGYGGLAVAYGNSNALNASYVSGPPGVLRIIWSNQIPSNFGQSPIGASGYWSLCICWLWWKAGLILILVAMVPLEGMLVVPQMAILVLVGQVMVTVMLMEMKGIKMQSGCRIMYTPLGVMGLLRQVDLRFWDSRMTADLWTSWLASILLICSSYIMSSSSEKL